ncbi:MAG: tRNA (adenosine(37)-N6)-threonylcarbamoyltransferase complex dimerization subunit type 1 TsaB, partial [Lysobacterales bacterium]
VALFVDGEVRSRFDVVPRRHAELVLPWADELLAECGIARSDLDAIACTRGPGAFTGVRLGIAVAQGIALALDLPIVAASSLRVLVEPYLAAARADHAGVMALLDARMGELYAAAWSAAHLPGDATDLAAAQAATLPESLCAPGSLADLLRAGDKSKSDESAARWILCGSGVAIARAPSDASVGHVIAEHPEALPHAENLARLAADAYARGEAIDAAAVLPVYLRNNVAQTIAQRAAQTIAS